MSAGGTDGRAGQLLADFGGRTLLLLLLLTLLSD
jgi:hypothetical protein